MFKILKQPFPIDPSVRSKFVMAVFFGFFVFGFLLVFKPFELDRYPFADMLRIAAVYGSITFGCIFIACVFAPMFFPGAFLENRWTTGKQIGFTLATIFFVGLVNYIVSPLMVATTLNWYNAFWFQGITVTIGLIPVSIFFLLKQNQLLKKFAGEAAVLEQKLQKKQEEEVALVDTATQKVVSNKIILTGDYNDERVELYPDDLYMITSASNYIKLFHVRQQKLLYTIIRSTLKKAEGPVLGNPSFFKCHRAYIINLDKVEHVEGNAQGYKVRLKSCDELIPVSRNLNNEFSDKLLAFRNMSSLHAADSK